MEKSMHTRHVGISLLGMALLGSLAFWILQALAGTRVAQPIGAAPTVAATEPGSAAASLRTGTETALATAVRAVHDGRRAEAVAAMDAARRAARVGHEAGLAGFQGAVDAIEEARRTVQNGDFAGTAPVLSRGLDELRATRSSPSGDGSSGVPAGQLADYRGATVLNAEGVRIGELEDANGVSAAIFDGSKRDAFGFIDRGGARIEVPTKQLVFGRRHRAGDTLVVLSTHAMRFADLPHDLGSHAAE